MLSRSISFAKERGLWSLLAMAPRYAYQHILRPRLPRTSTVEEYNGVRVRPYHLGDSLVPFEISPNQGGHPNPSEYEAELVDQINARVESTDTVVVIGGGLGISAVTAARRARDGEVIVYEAGRELTNVLPETARRNNVAGRVTVEHAIVGDAVKIEGEARGATVVDPGDLPECDVLVMDCEGAEVQILSALQIRPRELVVETHGNRTRVESLLKNANYRIESCQVAERPPLASRLRENGVFVLGAAHQTD